MKVNALQELLKKILISDPNRCGRRIIGQKGSEKKQIRQHYYHVKVMGGNNAEFGEHPWAVAVFEKNGA